MMDAHFTRHKKAWENLAKRAQDDPYAKYALYASRTLAVKHPDVYLVGDNAFYEGAQKINGFRESYDEPTALGWCHMHSGHEFFEKGEDYKGIPDGKPLLFGDLKLDKYRPTQARRIYPEPYLPLIDYRLGPLALTLKTEGKVVTSLELAEMIYFQAKATGVDVDHLFLILCDDEEAYLVNGGNLISVRSGSFVSSMSGNPVLIFNEASVWYPMMARDDRAQNGPLREVVNRFVKRETEPAADEWDLALIDVLKDVSALDDDAKFRMAALASVRAGGWRFHPYARLWKGFVPEEDLDIDISRRLGLIREFDRLANSVSPATAYLIGVMGDGTIEERLRRLSREYLLNTGVVREAEAHGWKKAWRLESWGHLWPCGLMEHTIDDAFRSRTGHCVSQAHMIAGVLEMAEIPHVVVNFDRGGVKEGVNHHFVLSQDGSFLFDDGIVNFREVDPPTEDYGPLLSFSIGGQWASTVGDKLYGNIPSEKIAEKIDQISDALANRFELRFYADEPSKKTLSKDGFIRLLETQAAEYVPLQ